MSKIVISSIIAIVGCVVQLLILWRAHLQYKKAKASYELSIKKRKAVKIILDFAEEWRKPMSDDERMNLVIEWHDKLAAANVIIKMSDDEL